MARLIVDGVGEMRAVDHNSAELLHLIELQQQGRALVEGGLGMNGLAAMERDGRAFRAAWLAWDARRKASAEAEEPFTEDEPAMPDSALLMTGVAVFLSRRAAGHRVSLVEALQVPAAAVRIEPDPEDAPEDPQGPAGAGQGSVTAPDAGSAPVTE